MQPNTLTYKSSINISIYINIWMNLYYDGDIIQSSILIMSFYKKAGDQNLLKTTNKSALVLSTCHGLLYFKKLLISLKMKYWCDELAKIAKNESWVYCQNKILNKVRQNVVKLVTMIRFSNKMIFVYKIEFQSIFFHCEHMILFE